MNARRLRVSGSALTAAAVVGLIFPAPGSPGAVALAGAANLAEALGNETGSVQLSYGAVARTHQGSLVSLQCDVGLTNAGSTSLEDAVLVLVETSPRGESTRRLPVGRVKGGETVTVRAGPIVYVEDEEPPRLRWSIQYRNAAGGRVARDVRITTGHPGP